VNSLAEYAPPSFLFLAFFFWKFVFCVKVLPHPPGAVFCIEPLQQAVARLFVESGLESVFMALPWMRLHGTFFTLSM
jgi:hypothetical protein